MENISTRGGNQEKNGDLALRNSVVSAGWLWAVGRVETKMQPQFLYTVFLTSLEL